MKEHGFYILKDEYINLINTLGGKYADSKSRPIYCCIKDNRIDGLFWLIPTSDLSHRTSEQIEKFRKYEQCDDIRAAYYHIGKTTKPALYKISNALPATDKYILKEFLNLNRHLVLEDKAEIQKIERKLRRILSYENSHPNRLEQHITAVKMHMVDELLAERQPVAPEKNMDGSDLESNKYKAAYKKLAQENIDLQVENAELYMENQALKNQLAKSQELEKGIGGQRRGKK